METTLDHIKTLVEKREVCVSNHGYDELAADGLLVCDIVAGVPHAELLEDYPDYSKGPCALVLQRDPDGNPVHAVWGIPRGKTTPAVLVTAYRPDPKKWTNDFRSRIR